MEGIRVITSSEMARVEKKSIEAGCSGEEYMETAGLGIANWVEECAVDREVTLLVGKGNNGGDAFVAGCLLLERGLAVKAVHLFAAGECSELCQKHRTRFEKMGGTVSSDLDFTGVILDGLLGTGFQGEAQGVVKEAIDAVNRSECPVIAIDIPSGLNGNTGEGHAIHADVTIFLGFPKLGFFIGNGWNCVGQLLGVDFGLPKEYVDQLEPKAHLIDEKQLVLPEMDRSRHKYKAGYVVSLAGSPGMGGAAELSAHAALRSGAGILRLFHPPEMEEELAGSFPELIRSPLVAGKSEALFKEVKRAKSLLIGPGLGKKPPEDLIRDVLKTGLPAVVDADGLVVFQKEVECGDVVLTPHHGEFVKMIGAQPDDLFAAAQHFVEERGVTLVLKGAPTWIFRKGKSPLIATHGDPGMATAGSGDVLTGVIAGLLAQGVSGEESAALGTYLHGIAGEKAARALSSHSVMASDILDFLPEAILSLS